MIDWLRALVADPAFPNLHPLLVHLPLALLPTALLFDVWALLARRRLWLERAAAALYLLGTVGAAAAYLSGQQASADMWEFPGAAQTTLADHEDLALLTLIGFAGITLVRVTASWLARNDKEVPVGFFRLLAVLAAIAGLVLLLLTADHGGRLVFTHGMGVDGAPFVESEAEPPLEP